MIKKTLMQAISIAAILEGSSAAAATISLGASSQNYTLYGQGAYTPGLGSFTNEQGSESTSGGVTTDTLSGMITSSDTAAFASGSYALITTYSGVPIAAGGSEIQSESNPANPNYFFYSFLDPSVDMTLYLTGTPSGSYTIPLVSNGNIDSTGFSFTFSSASCNGVSICGQNNVGLTPGSSLYGPTNISVSFNTLPVASVPEAGTWAMMLVGFGAIGFAARRRQLVRVACA